MNEPAIKPCPRCGRTPRLKHRWFDASAGRRCMPQWLITYWYECRRWFGLRLCTRGPMWTCTKDWSDLARRTAGEKWNTLS